MEIFDGEGNTFHWGGDASVVGLFEQLLHPLPLFRLRVVDGHCTDDWERERGSFGFCRDGFGEGRGGERWASEARNLMGQRRHLFTDRQRKRK